MNNQLNADFSRDLNDERLQAVAKAISNAPFPSKASLNKAREAIAVADATRPKPEVTQAVVLNVLNVLSSYPAIRSQFERATLLAVARDCSEAAFKEIE